MSTSPPTTSGSPKARRCRRVGVQASLSRSEDARPARAPGTRRASIGGRLTVPLYQGGEVASSVRQYKETLGQRRIDLDSSRAQVRQAFVSAWGELDAARAQVTAAETQVSAQQLALDGVIEERRVGQRTTLDVLNSQQDLLEARVALVNAQYRRVVGAYTVLSAYGKLDAQTLGLAVDIYDPTEHYNAVKRQMGRAADTGRPVARTASGAISPVDLRIRGIHSRDQRQFGAALAGREGSSRSSGGPSMRTTGLLCVIAVRHGRAAAANRRGGRYLCRAPGAPDPAGACGPRAMGGRGASRRSLRDRAPAFGVLKMLAANRCRSPEARETAGRRSSPACSASSGRRGTARFSVGRLLAAGSAPGRPPPGPTGRSASAPATATTSRSASRPSGRDLKRDAMACAALCPGQDVALYVQRNPSEDGDGDGVARRRALYGASDGLPLPQPVRPRLVPAARRCRRPRRPSRCSPYRAAG